MGKKEVGLNCRRPEEEDGGLSMGEALNGLNDLS